MVASRRVIDTFQEVSTKIKEASEFVKVVSVALDQQRIGVSEIISTINQLSQAIQTTAGIAERSSVMAQRQLEDQSSALKVRGRISLGLIEENSGELAHGTEEHGSEGQSESGRRVA